MNDNNLYDLLTSLNQCEDQKLLFSRPLTDFVELAVNWIEIIDAKTGKKTYFGPETVYLIKNKPGGAYIGLVEDRKEYDLHWYVLPEYRAKGHLSTALRTVILRHLFQDNRDFQCITINGNLISKENYHASSKLAEAIGFTFTREEGGIAHYKLSPEIYDGQEHIDGDLSALTDFRAEEIRNKIKYHFTLLKILQSELEMKLGKTEILISVKDELDQLGYNFDTVILDAFTDHNIVITKGS